MAPASRPFTSVSSLAPSRCWLGLTGFVVVPLRRTGVMTIPEFYNLRFGPRTRVLGGVLLALGGILNMGLFLQVGADFVVAVTGMDQDGPVLKLVMVALLVLVLIYTVLGGMVSVVLTDYVQFVVLSLGLVFIVALTTHHLGFDFIVKQWQAHQGEAGFSPIEGHGFGYMSWQAVIGFVSCAVWPTAVTRALSARNETVVRRQYALSSVSFMIRFMIPCFMGIAAFVFLVQAGATMLNEGGVKITDGEVIKGFTLDTAGGIYKTTQAYPVMLREMLPAGVLGLITAGMLAAFMSTNDSYLLCWASVLARDVFARNSPERVQLLWTRVGIVVIGIYVLVFGLYFKTEQDLWEYLGITGAVYFTGAIVVLVAGLYWRRASSTGAVCALLAGLSALVGLKPLQEIVHVEWESWAVGLVTLGIAILAMIVGSLLAPDPPRDSNFDLQPSAAEGH